MAAADPNPLPITELFSGREIAHEFAAALARGFLDEKFFYWLPESVQAWVRLCRAPEYRNANRALNLLFRVAPRLAELWPGSDALCSLGCGEGSKDRLLLDAFAARRRLVSYLGVDFSQPLLELALARALPAARSVRGFVIDILSAPQLSALGSEIHDTTQSCIYAVLGNTLGAFDPDTFPARLRRLLRPQDRALFDGEIFDGAETLRGYDNPSNRRFAFAPLAGIGLTQADGDLVFELHPGCAGLHQVVKYFVPARDLTLNLFGRRLRFARGDKLRMSSSLKYDQPAFFERIERAGFAIEFFDHSDDGRFLLAAGSPA